MGVRSGRIEQMIEAGELERVGDDPTADPRVYRETGTGRYRIGCDVHGLWADRWATERQARAIARAHDREVDEGLRSVGLASIDASAAHAAASPLLAQAAALLARAAEALEETPQAEGDGPGGGAILLNLDDPADATLPPRRRSEREAEEEATPIKEQEARLRGPAGRAAPGGRRGLRLAWRESERPLIRPDPLPRPGP